MNNINWGTRDSAKPAPSAEEIEQQQKSQAKDTDGKKKKKEKGAIEFSLANLFKCMLCTQDQSREYDSEYKELTTALIKIDNRLDEMENGTRKLRDVNHHNHHHRSDNSTEDGIGINPSTRRVDFVDVLNEDEDSIKSSEFDESDDFDGADSIGGASIAQESDSFLVSPNWLHSKDLGKGEVEYLKQGEEDFWKQFIGAYLEPIDKDPKREADIAKKILDLRDQYVFKFFMINALFVLIIFLMQLQKDLIHLKWPIGMKYNVTYSREVVSNKINIESEYLRLEPIGFVFILGFLFVLLIQFIAMLFHRFDTFSHIMAKVSLDFRCCDKALDLSEEAKNERLAEKIMRELERNIDDVKDDNRPSTLPPRKRMTIKQTIDETNRKQSYVKSFGSELQKNLDASGQTGGSMLSKRLSRVLTERRRTVIAQRRREKQQWQQQQQQPPQQPSPVQQRTPEVVYAVANNEVNNELRQRPSPEVAYVYDNQAFAVDESLKEERV